MPRTYKKKGKRCNWTTEDLEKAIHDIKNSTFTIRAASRAYSIPRTTLQEYINVGKGKRVQSEQHVPGHIGCYPVLGPEFEEELCSYAKRMSDLYFGINKSQLCKIAFELAERNNLKHKFNSDKKMAGNEWFGGFMNRNPTIALRKPESTSMARVIGFRRGEVGRFYQNLGEVLSKEKIDVSRIYNVEETGMSTVQKQKEKILSPKGKKQVGIIVSAEKGETITAVACISACGVYVPPMLIFPRKNFNERLLHGAPPGSIGVCSQSGWINSELFVKWLEHFVSHSRASTERKVLLVLDNHESHISLEAWDVCKRNGITMVSLPPHCSHKCQPLDLTVFGPLKTAYYRRCNEWMSSNAGKRITQYEVAQLFGEAYSCIASVEKCKNGFKAAGIVPLNSAVFSDEDFAAADALLKPKSDQTNTEIVDRKVQEIPEISVCPASNSGSSPMDIEEPNSNNIQELQVPTVSESMNMTVMPDLSNNRDASVTVSAVKDNQPVESMSSDAGRVSVTAISPFPVVQQKKTTRKSKCKRSEILTATPLKALLQTKAKESQRKKEAKEATEKRKETKRSLQFDCKNKASAKVKKAKKTLVAGKDKKADKSGKTVKSSDIWICSSCQMEYGDQSDPKINEDWVQCAKCGSTFHITCGEDFGVLEDGDAFWCKDCIC